MPPSCVLNSTVRVQKEEPKKQAIALSRGGLTTKIHTTVDALGNPTGFHLTPGQTPDLEGADVLLKDTLGDTIIADKAYDVRTMVIQPLLDKCKSLVIPLRSKSKHPREHDQHLYKARHLIENFFARLKKYCAIASKSDSTYRKTLIDPLPSRMYCILL